MSSGKRPLICSFSGLTLFVHGFFNSWTDQGIAWVIVLSVWTEGTLNIVRLTGYYLFQFIGPWTTMAAGYIAAVSSQMLERLAPEAPFRDFFECRYFEMIVFNIDTLPNSPIT